MRASFRAVALMALLAAVPAAIAQPYPVKSVRVIAGFPPGSGAESGLKGYETLTWFGFVAPVRTPGEIVTRLNADIVKILALADTRQLFAAQGIETYGGTPEQFASYIRDEIAKWAKVIRLSGAKAE